MKLKVFKEIGKILLILIVGFMIMQFGRSGFFENENPLRSKIDIKPPIITTTLVQDNPNKDYSNESFMYVAGGEGTSRYGLISFERRNYNNITLEIPLLIYRNPSHPVRIFIFYNLSIGDEKITWSNFPHDPFKMVDPEHSIADEYRTASISSNDGQAMIELLLNGRKWVNLTILMALNQDDPGLLKMYSLSYQFSSDDNSKIVPHIKMNDYDNLWEIIGGVFIISGFFFMYFPKNSDEKTKQKKKIITLLFLYYLICIIFNIYLATTDDHIPFYYFILFNTLALFSPMVIYLGKPLIVFLLKILKITSRESEVITLKQDSLLKNQSVFDRFNASLYLRRAFWIYFTIISILSLTMNNPIMIDMIITTEERNLLLATGQPLGFSGSYLLFMGVFLEFVTPLIWVPLWWLEDQHIMLYEKKLNHYHLKPIHNTVKKALKGLFGISSIFSFINWFQASLITYAFAPLVSMIFLILFLTLLFTLPFYLFYLKISNTERLKIDVKCISSSDL